MKLQIAKLAQQEFHDAKQFYELEQAGLGTRFEKDIKIALQHIKQFGFAWPIERGEVRRYILHRFPYKILYSIQEDTIIVLAFAHQHRKPDYWIDR
tara:strand:+ start:306 stop:593 length:288 start_codon:yes stop_codon:yes gene_type:complete